MNIDGHFACVGVAVPVKRGGPVGGGFGGRSRLGFFSFFTFEGFAGCTFVPIVMVFFGGQELVDGGRSASIRLQK